MLVGTVLIASSSASTSSSSSLSLQLNLLAEKDEMASSAFHFDVELFTLREMFHVCARLHVFASCFTLSQDLLVTAISDPSSDVRQTLVSNNIGDLCLFLGHLKGLLWRPAVMFVFHLLSTATEVLLCHMLTFFNDKKDWRLRSAFFENIVVWEYRCMHWIHHHVDCRRCPPSLATTSWRFSR